MFRYLNIKRIISNKLISYNCKNIQLNHCNYNVNNKYLIFGTNNNSNKTKNQTIIINIYYKTIKMSNQIKIR
jgi:hypothetical protein